MYLWNKVFCIAASVLVSSTLNYKVCAADSSPIACSITNVKVNAYKALRSYNKLIRGVGDAAFDNQKILYVSMKVRCSGFDDNNDSITYNDNHIFLNGKDGKKIKPFASGYSGSYGNNTVQYQFVKLKKSDSVQKDVLVMFRIPDSEQSFDLNFADQKVKLDVPKAEAVLNKLNKPVVKILGVKKVDSLHIRKSVASNSLIAEYKPPAGTILGVTASVTYKKNKEFSSPAYVLNTFNLDLAYREDENEGVSHCMGVRYRDDIDSSYVSKRYEVGVPETNTFYFIVPGDAKAFKLFMFGELLVEFDR